MLTNEEIKTLPPEVLKELKYRRKAKHKTPKWVRAKTDMLNQDSKNRKILDILKERPLDLDHIIYHLYTKHHITCSRIYIHNDLYKLIKRGCIERNKGKYSIKYSITEKGINSLNKINQYLEHNKKRVKIVNEFFVNPMTTATDKEENIPGTFIKIDEFQAPSKEPKKSWVARLFGL
jgi:predicted transcriptional regulator